jgi:hypothetical protein
VAAGEGGQPRQALTDGRELEQLGASGIHAARVAVLRITAMPPPSNRM